MRRNNYIVLLLAALVLLGSSCERPKGNSSTSGLARIYCDESFQNILEEEISVFEYLYPDASIMPTYLNEHDALDSLLRGKVDVIITAHDLTPEQREGLKRQNRGCRSREIAVDAVAIIVNKANDIDELSMDDLRDIFQGKVHRWGEVFPTSMKNDSIRVLFDGSGTSVIHYMKEKFLGANGSFGPNVYAKKSSQEVFDIVERDKNVIGFIGVSWITSDLKGVEKTMDEKYEALKNNEEVTAIDFTDRIKVMPVRADDQVRAFKPYQAYIFTGEYPLVRKIWAIDASFAGMLDHGFYVFLTGSIGQKIILQTGILPAAEPVRRVELQ